MRAMNFADYGTVQSLLAGAGLDQTPAEFHGQITGLWCRYAQLPPDLGLVDVNPGGVAWAEVLDFAMSVWGALEDPECGYEPLLPDDERPLGQRVEAMADWCEALLYGIGHAGPLDDQDTPAEVREALTDITEISRVQLGDGDQADEQAWTEIVEYLRVLAQTIYVELHPRPPEPDHHEH